MDTSRAILRRTQILWCLRSLLPYGCLSAIASALVIAGSLQFDWPQWLLAACLGSIALAVLFDKNWRLSAQQLCQKLDGQCPELQDSSQLLCAPAHNLTALTRLQRQRTAEALQCLQKNKRLNKLNPPWRSTPLSYAAGVCTGLVLLTVVHIIVSAMADGSAGAVVAGPAVQQHAPSLSIIEATTDITPPHYSQSNSNPLLLILMPIAANTIIASVSPLSATP